MIPENRTAGVTNVYRSGQGQATTGSRATSGSTVIRATSSGRTTAREVRKSAEAKTPRRKA